jgi:hypothetical protein
MAEIKIEEKKSPVWLWILLAILIIGALLYFLVFRNGDGDHEADAYPAATTTETGANNVNTSNEGAVGEYVQYLNTIPMDLDHEYSSGAIERLTNAVEAKAKQVNYEVTADLDKVRESKEHITQDPMATTHSNHVKRAADILAGVMQRMQQAHFSNLQNEASEVQNAAGNIKSADLLLNQKDAVKSFFDKSAQLLQKMN